MGSKENGEERENETERDSNSNSKQSKEGDDSDYEPARDSLSSQEDLTKTPNKKSVKVPKNSDRSFFRPTKSSSNRLNNNNSSKPQSKSNHKKPQKSIQNSSTKNQEIKKTENSKFPSRPSSETSEIETLTEIQIDGTDDESQTNSQNNSKEKSEEMEIKIEKLEQELREVAALEISIYSVVPEHMSSVHKVHTPARRLSRLYINVSKNWPVNKKATVGKNTVSGLVLVAKSCGNDVSRLMYWLSNTVVLREIISQILGNESQFSPKLDSNLNNLNGKDLGIFLPTEDWRETFTFISALERIESWIFSRIVESVWWQALTPHMQSQNQNSTRTKNKSRTNQEPDLINQGNFSIDLWNRAFNDAFTKLCPLRSNGHECGCLPILAKMVMEQCVARLDVAMFNAILRESASEIPTDPISDPIVDIQVLPIPAGDLSFGSGAQLKNSIGNWSRWLSDNFGLDSDDSLKEQEEEDMNFKSEEDMIKSSKKSKTFQLLNELSDLLMLPKDLLLDKSIRKEVCPSIALSLVIRILCNFTPDEFCPDPVPGLVLEDLNSESMEERLSDKILSAIFPYSASKVAYITPSSADVTSENVNSRSPKMERTGSMVVRRGYTSDEDLDDLDSPMSLIIDRTPPVTPNNNGNNNENGNNGNGLDENLRYKLLREIWCE